MRSLLFEFVAQRGPIGPHMDQTTLGLILFGLFAALFGIAVLLAFFPRLERVKSTEAFKPEVERLEEKVDEVAEGVEDLGGGQALDVAMRLLEPDERRVVEALSTAGGSMLQKDISYELGFSRVKTHRVLVKLLRRGVVTAEKHYNTNRIELADWLVNSKQQ
jgi:uncharacterized membrane protein